MKNLPFTIKLALVLILANALIWLAFAIIVGTNLHPAMPAEPLVRWGMAGASLVAGLVLGLLAFSLSKRMKFAWYLALIGFSGLVVLTIADDVGWVDILYIVIALIPLILLIRDRKWYLGEVKNGDHP